MNWFQQLLGFPEPTDRIGLYQQLSVQGEWLHHPSTGRRWRCGRLEVPTLAQMRQRNTLASSGTLSLCEVVGDVQQLHLQHPQALFQAASQFNLLEMATPQLTPDDGVGLYSYDHTQGPACAIACGAGTIFRNYFAPVGEQRGQSAQHQINTLDQIERVVHNAQHQYWEVQNGYQWASTSDVQRLNAHLATLSSSQQDALGAQLRIGIQSETEVTLAGGGHTVAQAYCSGVPVGYTEVSPSDWAPFARLILSATYEATFWAAWEQYQRTGVGQLFLTLVGGGVFANPLSWILEAIERCLIQFRDTPLSVAIVSYGQSNPLVQNLVARYSATNLS